MDDLPAEIMLHLASYCPIRAVVNLLSCNQALHAYMCYDPLWHDLNRRDFDVKPDEVELGDSVSTYITWHGVKNAVDRLHWMFCPDAQLPSNIVSNRRILHVRSVYYHVHVPNKHLGQSLYTYHNILRTWFDTIFAPIKRLLITISRSRGPIAAVEIILKINNRVASPYVTDRSQKVVMDLLNDAVFDIHDTSDIIAAIDMIAHVDTMTAYLPDLRTTLPTIVVKLINRTGANVNTCDAIMDEIWDRCNLRMKLLRCVPNEHVDDVMVRASNIIMKQMRDTGALDDRDILQRYEDSMLDMDILEQHSFMDK